MHARLLCVVAINRTTETVNLLDLFDCDHVKANLVGCIERCLQSVEQGFAATKSNVRLMHCVRMGDAIARLESQAECTIPLRVFHTEPVKNAGREIDDDLTFFEYGFS